MAANQQWQDCCVRCQSCIICQYCCAVVYLPALSQHMNCGLFSDGSFMQDGGRALAVCLCGAALQVLTVSSPSLWSAAQGKDHVCVRAGREMHACCSNLLQLCDAGASTALM